jgi:hypothetical protein
MTFYNVHLPPTNYWRVSEIALEKIQSLVLLSAVI